jgi:hypothetical protein
MYISNLPFLAFNTFVELDGVKDEIAGVAGVAGESKPPV